MSEEELLSALKSKGLPTFGTRSERTDRLKKHYGITGSNQGGKAKVIKEINKI